MKKINDNKIPKLMIILGIFISTFLYISCSMSKSASYHYAQKQIEHGHLDFHKKMRVDEYLNAFSQFGIELDSSQAIKIQIDPFTSLQPKSYGKNFIQIGVKTRLPTTEEKRDPISLCFVLDISGSMNADNKAFDAITALKNSVMELNNGDEFALILFSNEAENFIPTTTINPQSRKDITNNIDKIIVGGGTDIEAGIKEGYKEMSNFKNSGFKRLVLLTDGQSPVLLFAPESIASAAGVEYNSSFKISTIGLGIGVEQDILRRIAEEGKGYYYFAENSQTLTKILREELRTMIVPVVENVKIKCKFASNIQIIESYGIPDSIKNKMNFTIDLGTLNVDEWRIIIFEIEGDPNNWDPIPLKAKLTYNLYDSDVNQESNVIATLKQNTDLNEKPIIHTYVARNSVLLSNVKALIKIGELSEEAKYIEGLDIIETQIKNDSAVLKYGDQKEMENELKSLKSVKSILEEKEKNRMYKTDGSKTNIDSTQFTEIKKESKISKIAKTSAKLAIDMLPGPWRTAAELFMIIIE